MPNGETLTFETGAVDEGIYIDVTDTGTGMTDEVLEHCLGLFYTTKGEVGTGLGLGVAQAVMKRYGGLITVESELGTGTALTIRFPKSQRPDMKNTDLNGDEGREEKRKLRVLLAEDEPVGRTLVKEILTADGHTVELAKNGREALSEVLGEERLLRPRHYRHGYARDEWESVG